MSFGYNSAVCFNPSKWTIADYARLLLNDLHAERRENNVSENLRLSYSGRMRILQHSSIARLYLSAIV
jgi:hypothetical protein